MELSELLEGLRPHLAEHHRSVIEEVRRMLDDAANSIVREIREFKETVLSDINALNAVLTDIQNEVATAAADVQTVLANLEQQIAAGATPQDVSAQIAQAQSILEGLKSLDSIATAAAPSGTPVTGTAPTGTPVQGTVTGGGANTP